MILDRNQSLLQDITETVKTVICDKWKLTVFGYIAD